MNKIRIIAEIGINHDGSEDRGRALIDAAARAHVWGVKFQYRNLTNSYAAGAKQIGDEILKSEIAKTFLPASKLTGLARYAKTLGLRAGISFFIPDDMKDFGNEIGEFDFFKVPSVEFTHLALIDAFAAKGKPCLISTGAYAEPAIVQVLGQLDRAIWTPLHCISNYPVAIANPRLGYIDHLRGLWGDDVGYSSHDDNWEMCLLAMQKGATIIERHITYDKSADGLDHSTSSTPDEFAKMADFAENLDLILAGNGPRVPNQGELLNLQNLGRSYYAKADIDEGEPVTRDKLVLRSPRTGMGQEDANVMLGRPAVRAIGKHKVIDRSVFERPRAVDEATLTWARDMKLSIPVRFHDMDGLAQRLPVGHFEFHLTFGDVAGGIDASAFDRTNHYSVHLPDYVSSTLLMDPFSPRDDQRTASFFVLNRTVEFAKALQDRTGRECLIVGSFSTVHATLDEFFRQHADLLANYARDGVTILPQWLPPIAWYFGGAAKLKAMNNLGDIALIKRHRMPICMDVCHLCMGDKVFDFIAADVVKDLAPLTRHVHIADALGHDGEGLPFGAGDPSNMDAITAAMALDCIKVIEVWQGHLNGGDGFAKALLDLKERFNGR